MDKETWIFVIIIVLIGVGSIFVLIDPIPATDEECHRIEGGYDHIHKWCDCKKSWVGGALNKSYSECHAKAGE